MVDICCFDEVAAAVFEEREYQIEKYGIGKEQSLAGFILIMESELNEVKLGWNKDLSGRNAPLNEIVQLAATCFACLEQYGVSGNTKSTNDIPVVPYD